MRLVMHRSEMQISNAQNYNHEAHEERMMKNTKNKSKPSFLSLLWTINQRLSLLNFGHLNLFGI
jgi:hypothetical protein